MNQLTRRDLLSQWGAVTAGAVSLGFGGLRLFSETPVLRADEHGRGYGELVRDRKRRIDLPKGFSYKVISKVGNKMADGFRVPGSPDGMAAFAGPDDLTVLLRNHELYPTSKEGPFGRRNKLLDLVPDGMVYDDGNRRTPGLGGTTTIVYNTRRKQVVGEFLSLAGTYRNCAGGPTPWGSWLTCEETVQRVGTGDNFQKFVAARDHGYVFEVPASIEPGLAAPEPIREMGRFRHEAVAIDPSSGVVYLTEDCDDGLLFRFLPKVADKLHQGGRLQALGLLDNSSGGETRNWDMLRFGPGEPLPVRWIDMDNVESPLDDLRVRGFRAGAARFARGEGIWYGQKEVYFACTDGGRARLGQIWRYRPSPHEGTEQESTDPGQLELFIEPNDSRLIDSADNLTVAPWGDLVVCEDRKGAVVRMVGVTPAGDIYTLAHSHLRTEFAGVTFSPDGSTLFVNAQGKGLTFAITGPWKDTVA